MVLARTYEAVHEWAGVRVTMKIVFDIKRMRPACALLQAVMGGSQGIAHGFDSDTWLLVPTPDMSVYEITPEQLKQLQDKVNHPLRHQSHRTHP